MGVLRQFRRAFRRGLSAQDDRSPHRRVVSLSPDGREVGRVLLSYVIDPFLASPGEDASNAHTHHWESLQIAQTFLDRGYCVDVVSYLNHRFVPQQPYRFLVAARTDLQRLSQYLPSDCVKVAHLDTAHWIVNNAAAYDRLLGLQLRKQVSLTDPKLVESNLAIECADLGTVLGNDYTLETYRYAGKPLYRIPISAPAVYDWPTGKDFDVCRNRFVWFGSAGFVHKGLDLVLDAFAGLPGHHLTVCGPLDQEPEFCSAYRRELYDTPNIHAHGWIDVESESFHGLMRNTLGLIYPTCAEGGGGSAISCMHAATIPILPREASVDLGAGGVVLDNCSVERVQAVVRDLAHRPADELEGLARSAWEQARNHHTRPAFAQAFAGFVDDVLLPVQA